MKLDIQIKRSTDPQNQGSVTVELSGSLDTATGEAVIALMFELNRDAGSTLVLVTHDRSVAARCGRILTIDAGRVSAAQLAAYRAGMVNMSEIVGEGGKTLDQHLDEREQEALAIRARMERSGLPL